jgi:hypothetical protein
MNTQPPIEDINAIVNRFQAWAGAQAPARAKDGVRELTYDEAIRSRRHRTSAEATLPAAEKPAPASPTNARRRKTEKPAKPKKKTAAPRHATHAQPKDVQHSSARARVVAPEPLAFRQVLAETVSILPAASSQKLALAERRTTALSLRISSEEHALLRRRATEANLSVSCYLRNCVFEVESLRAQLALTLAEQQPMQLQAPSRLFTYASFTSFVRRLFFGKTASLAIHA